MSLRFLMDECLTTAVIRARPSYADACSDVIGRQFKQAFISERFNDWKLFAEFYTTRYLGFAEPLFGFNMRLESIPDGQT